MENIEKMSLHFEGDNDIELETLSVALNSTLSCLKAIADNTLSENDFCKLKVKSVERGSFIINIELIKNIAETFIAYGPTIVEIFSGFLEIRKHLKGETAKKIEKKGNDIVITNSKNNTFVTNQNIFNIYTSDNDIEKSLAKMNKYIGSDSTRCGFKIQVESPTNENKVVEYSKDELKLSSNSIDAESLSYQENCEVNTVWAKIRKPDLSGDSKWDLIVMESQKISANFEDEKFLKKLHNNEIALKSGTKLKIELRMKYTKKNNEPSTQIKKISYSVMKVLDIKDPENYDQEALNI